MLSLKINTESLGLPDIELAGLKIWMHSRKYPNRHDFWDGNWLETTILCQTDNAAFWESRDFLRNTEIEEWLVAAEALNETFLGEANLNPLEKVVKIKICPETYHRISIKVYIYPEGRFQQHYFEYWLNRDSLKELIKSCRKILLKFPIRGSK